MKEITSRDNQWVKMACSLKQKKGRQKEHRFFAEGWRILCDAAAAGIQDAVCFVSAKGLEHAGFAALQQQGEALGWDFFAVTDSVYDKLKDTKNPQGLAAMLPFAVSSLAAAEKAAERPLLYLEAIQDPGNLGTILRTAAAGDAGAVLISPGSVDPYNDKTVRSAMGALFKVPVVPDVTIEDVQRLRQQHGCRIVGATPRAGRSYADISYKEPVILAFGNEGNGLSAEFLTLCDDLIGIPMKQGSESLNLSLSVGIVLYKAWEERGFKE